VPATNGTSCTACPTGQVAVNGMCQAALNITTGPICPTGQAYFGGKCQPCPTGQSSVSGKCQISGVVGGVVTNTPAVGGTVNGVGTVVGGVVTNTPAVGGTVNGLGNVGGVIARSTVTVTRLTPITLSGAQLNQTSCQAYQTLSTQQATAVNACINTNETTFNTTKSTPVLLTLCQQIGLPTIAACAAAPALTVAQDISKYCTNTSTPPPATVAAAQAKCSAGH
jgi:hypothetical protein